MAPHLFFMCVSREHIVNIAWQNATWVAMSGRRFAPSPRWAWNTSMKVAGLFAGIGGFELGLARAGHEAVLLCEIWEPRA
jgi:C-5 cytosine-specific DNA methylase